MNPVDWNQYPPLPEPPHLRWRDTPPREAYWRELCQRCNSPAVSNLLGCASFMVLWGVCAGILSGVLISCDYGLAVFGLGGGIALVLSFFIAIFIKGVLLQIWIFSQKLKLAKKYGFYMRKLKRPDLSREIGDIFAARPDFRPADFAKLWPSAAHAAVASKLAELASHNWYSCGKMLYPNDPLLLFFYGRQFRRGRNRMLHKDLMAEFCNFAEEVDDEFGFPDDALEELEPDTVTLAELVESCMACAREKRK